MKKFTIPCNFGGVKAPFDVYIGDPKPGNHPLQNQAAWLSSERGGTIPQEVMDSFAKLLDLSHKHKVSFPELCAHAMQAVNEDKQKAAAAPPQSLSEPEGPGHTPGYVPKEQKAFETPVPEKVPLPPQNYAQGAQQDKEKREKSQMAIGGGGGGGAGAGAPQPVATQTTATQKPEESEEKPA